MLADGDDTNGVDDEDGVTFETVRAGANAATVTVNVQDGPAKLDAWIDFNGDGSWSGAEEQIFASFPVGIGDNILTFPVPAEAMIGTTFARFRLSSAGGLLPFGLATDGEVEDYAVEIEPPVRSSGDFAPHGLRPPFTAWVTTALLAVDLDRDGDVDYLRGAIDNPSVIWSENIGSGNFTEHFTTSMFAIPIVRGIAATDLDGDGDLDVVEGSTRGIRWYRNDGSQVFTQAQSLTFPTDLLTGLTVADINDDGRPDVLVSLYNSDSVKVYLNDGSGSLTETTLTSTADGASSVKVADLDGDGDQDIVVSSKLDTTLAWFENQGADGYVRHVITTAREIDTVSLADMTGDGRIDIVANVTTSGIVMFRNNVSGSFSEITLVTGLPNLKSLRVADMNGDGRADIVSVDDVVNVVWHENRENGSFISHSVGNYAIDYTSLLDIADMDGDGDLDILTDAAHAQEITWYENLGLDFGNASPFGQTLMANNGARHTATGPVLGATRDSEVDALELAPVDNDGITFLTPLTVSTLNATTAQVDVGLTNPDPTANRLDAWIDLNGDGDFSDSGEQVLASFNLGTVAGNQTVTFSIPQDTGTNIETGSTWMRFRLSTTGGLLPTGAASDGEVEDYPVTLTPPPDLVATAFNAVADHVPSGLTDVQFTVQNTGAGPAGAFEVQVVWSPNGVAGDGDDVAIPSTVITIPGLAAGASTTRTVAVQLDVAALYAHSVATTPPGQPVGTIAGDLSWLFLVIDAADAVFETDETNNAGINHLASSDDIIYFPWDTNSDGVVTPLEALATIQAIGTSTASEDMDGNGVVTPLEALSTIQRIGYVIDSSVIGDTPPTEAQAMAAEDPRKQRTVRPIEARPLLKAASADQDTPLSQAAVVDSEDTAARVSSSTEQQQSSGTSIPSAAASGNSAADRSVIRQVSVQMPAAVAAVLSATDQRRKELFPTDESELLAAEQQAMAVAAGDRKTAVEVDLAYATQLDWLSVI
ncbi:MAG: FG-GAP-like repeat-containing protein [Planctomycetaceae bacterium]